MRLPIRFFLALCLFSLSFLPGRAEDGLQFGGDAYLAGANPSLTQAVGRDALISGFSVSIDAKVEKDAHAMGFDVNIAAPIGGDLYAMGFSVDVTQAVGDDVTVSGANVRLGRQAVVGGNARLAGGTILIDAPVAGDVLAAAGDLTINGVIAGDVLANVGTLTFGPDARIGGQLRYSASQPIAIPASVIAADRVIFEKREQASEVDTIRETVDRSMSHVWLPTISLVFGFAITLVFLLGLAGLMLHFVPRTSENLREAAIGRPLRAIGFGIFGLSALIGLAPLAAMTLIGLPLVPFILLAILLFWTGGYLLGLYAVSWQLALSLIKPAQATIGIRLIALGLGLCGFALLNFIPYLGWMINLLAVLFGMGGIAQYLIKRFLPDRRAVLSEAEIGPSGDGI